MGEHGAIKDRIKSLRRVRVSELHAHPKNFRKHDQGQRRAMSAALNEIGFADALLVRETDQGLQIIDGHLRADLAKDQKVPVLVLDVDEQEADKLLATFDAITGLAEIDEDLLRSLADGLEFEAPELDELVAGLLGDESTEITEDDPPEAQDGPCVVQVGDVWACGRHRVVCGDCRDTGRQPPDTAMLWSDPPYGLGGYAGRSGRFSAVLGDDADSREIEGFFGVGQAPEQYICCEIKSLCHLVTARGWPRSLIVWAKPHFGMGSGYRRQHEFIAYWGSFSGTTESDLWHETREGAYVHPTQKPVALPARAMRNSTVPNSVVYDPFLGAGTTLIAAEQLGRTCYGIEIEPRYIDVILQRYMNFTNVSPVRESDGALFSELVKGELAHV